MGVENARVSIATVFLAVAAVIVCFPIRITSSSHLVGGKPPSSTRFYMLLALCCSRDVRCRYHGGQGWDLNAPWRGSVQFPLERRGDGKGEYLHGYKLMEILR